MANSFKNAITPSIGTSPVTVYTATGQKCIALQLDVANIIASGITVDVTIRDSSASVTGYLVKGAPIPVGGSLTVINDSRKVVLESGDYIQVVSTAATSVSVVMSVLEGVS